MGTPPSWTRPGSPRGSGESTASRAGRRFRGWAAPRRQALGHSLGTGGATEALGALGAWGPHEHLGLRRAGVTETVPPALEAAAAALLAHTPPDADAAARLDLRHQAVVTIDDPSTQGARPCGAERE